MITPEIFEALLPRAFRWVKDLEEYALERGAPLASQQIADAQSVGIEDYSRVRVLVVDRIPMPDDPDLAEATRRAQIITEATRCVGFGHVIIVRADSWGDRELLLHNLAHIAQCEQAGGLEQWVRRYLSDRVNCPRFTCGHLEEQARGLAREICGGAPLRAAAI